MRNVQFSLLFGFAVSSLVLSLASAFSPVVQNHAITRRHTTTFPSTTCTRTGTALNAAVPDLDTIALVTGQENYGLAIVLLGEAFWSFGKAPSVDHAIKTLVPASVAAVTLVAVSGPMVTSGDAASVSTGLFIATAVSIAMGGVYLARCLAPFSPSPKEIPALGVLVALAGFFSFSQNLVVDGFVTLPSIPLPSLPNPSDRLSE
mmetsp:Transcript_70934/g.198954  ORF Transcript_70934/g.198954 Transcript_70934/m.198954 type:complete len:204 (-) Transcript_70934:125-736(-)